MRYLENHSAYSTVTINIDENKVVVQDVEKEELKTWEKTKKTFAATILNIQKILSFFVIAFVGLSPVILFLVLLGVLIYVGRKRIKKNQKPDDTNYS